MPHDDLTRFTDRHEYADSARIPEQDTDAAEKSVNIEPTVRPEGVVLLNVSGDIDLLTAPILRKNIDNHLGGPHPLAVVLDDVGFLSSSGLSVLVDTASKATERALPWAVVARRHAVTRPLEATGLDRTLPLYEDVHTAVDVLSGKAERA